MGFICDEDNTKDLLKQIYEANYVILGSTLSFNSW